MKKTLALIFTILSLMIILDSFNVGEALFMFYLAGVIPGTNQVVQADRMLEIFTLLIGFTLSRIVMAIMRKNRNSQKTQKSASLRTA